MISQPKDDLQELPDAVAVKGKDVTIKVETTQP